MKASAATWRLGTLGRMGVSGSCGGRKYTCTGFTRMDAVTLTSRPGLRMVWAGLSCSAAIIMLSACDPDLTSKGFTFQIVNDTASPVIVTYCDNARCSKADWTETVPAGKALPANSAAEGFDEWYQFRVATTGALLGCRTLNFSKVQAGFVTRVTSSTPCSNH